MNSLKTLEEVMVAHFATVELDLIKSKSDEQADPSHVNGHYILDRLQAETDLLDRVAARVKAGMLYALSKQVL